MTGFLCRMPQIPVQLGVGTRAHGTGVQGNGIDAPGIAEPTAPRYPLGRAAAPPWSREPSRWAEDKHDH